MVMPNFNAEPSNEHMYHIFSKLKKLSSVSIYIGNNCDIILLLMKITKTS